MSKEYEIDKAGHILNPDNKFEVNFDNGMDKAGVELDALSISTPEGVRWLYLEKLGNGDYCLDLGDARTYLRVTAEGKVFLPIERDINYDRLEWADVATADELEAGRKLQETF